MNHYEYHGYMGSAEVDVDSGVLVGKLLFIRDTIAYSGNTAAELEKAFREAVDDYLETCAERGEEPDTPFKGSFNVRIEPDLHRRVAIKARSQGLSLNAFVARALEIASTASNAGAGLGFAGLGSSFEDFFPTAWVASGTNWWAASPSRSLFRQCNLTTAASGFPHRSLEPLLINLDHELNFVEQRTTGN